MRIVAVSQMRYYHWAAALCSSLCILSARGYAVEPVGRSRPEAGQPELRAWVVEGMRNGWIQCEGPTIKVSKDTLNWKINRPSGDLPGMVGSQVMVESIRSAFPRRDQRNWWEPHLRRVERVVADELSYRMETQPPDSEILAAYRESADRLIEGAGEAYAKGLGVAFQPYKSPEARQLEPVTLLTSTANSTLFIMPKSKYLISKISGDAPSFEAISSGSRTELAGSYAYKIRRPDGSETEVKFFEVRRGGTYRLE